MTKTQCAGLRVLHNTLEPNRETEIRSIQDRGPYGQIEDWDGSITVEITPQCFMGEDACRIVAEALAQDEMPRSVFVREWKFSRVGTIIQLIPAKWEELDVDSGLRIH